MLAAGVFPVWGVETFTPGQDQDVIQWDGLSGDTLRVVEGGGLGRDMDRGQFVRRRHRGVRGDRARKWKVGIGLELEQNRPFAPGVAPEGRVGLRDRREFIERAPGGEENDWTVGLATARAGVRLI